jgi:hypothetical protein
MWRSARNGTVKNATPITITVRNFTLIERSFISGLLAASAVEKSLPWGLHRPDRCSLRSVSGLTEEEGSKEDAIKLLNRAFPGPEKNPEKKADDS